MTEPAIGKFRAVVVDVADPSGLARLKVSLPDGPPGARAVWAMPCVPYAGPGQGAADVALPPAGTAVWVEFERGDPSRPVWTGRFWTDAQIRSASATRPEKERDGDTHDR